MEIVQASYFKKPELRKTSKVMNIEKTLEKPIWKCNMLCDSNHMTFGKKQNCWNSEKISGFRGWGGGGTSKALRICRALKILCGILYWWMHVIIHLSKLIERTTTRVNPNVNIGLWVIEMCQWRFLNCTILVGDAGRGGGCARVQAGDMWEISIPSFQFCCELKTALKRHKQP